MKESIEYKKIPEDICKFLNACYRDDLNELKVVFKRGTPINIRNRIKKLVKKNERKVMKIVREKMRRFYALGEEPIVEDIKIEGEEA